MGLLVMFSVSITDSRPRRLLRIPSHFEARCYGTAWELRWGCVNVCTILTRLSVGEKGGHLFEALYYKYCRYQLITSNK
jgi:hypothetical protein